jgi:acyl carrier protein
MKLRKIFSEMFALPETAIDDDLVLREIPLWDSMVHMMLIVRLEEAWNIQFTGDEIADIKTVADARRTIRAHGGEA